MTESGRRRAPLLVCAVAAAALSAAGCAPAAPSGGTPSRPASPAPSSSLPASPIATPASPTPSAPAASASPSAPAAPIVCKAPGSVKVATKKPTEGTTFGFVRHFDGANLYFDPAEFLTGEAGEKAAVQAGVIAEGDSLPNDYYIRNTDTAALRIPLADAARVSLLDNHTMASRSLTVKDLTALYCGKADASWLYSGKNEVPAHVVVASGRVTVVRQLYLP